jgi:hypothetical protein
MTANSWKSMSGVLNGDWNTSGHWTAGVPIAGSAARIAAAGTYTVTVSQNNSVGTLNMAIGAKLVIESSNTLHVTAGTATGVPDGTIDVEDGAALFLGTNGTNTTFHNGGAINLQPTSDLTRLVILGNVTLTGNGKITDLGGGEGVIEADGSGATLTNGNTTSGNTISGGAITVSFVNGTKGIVDATESGHGLYINTGGSNIINNGLMESTGAALELRSDITQGATGRITAATSGSIVFLDGITISKGAVSTVKGSTLHAEDGPSEINTTAAVSNAGTIVAANANLTIDGRVTNSSTGLLLTNNANLSVGGAVTGGKADIEGTGVVDFNGPSSAAVTFEAGATGGLLLGDAKQFTGTVAGMSAAPSAGIVLGNVAFADVPTVVFNPTTHLLTVTDPVSHVVDKIKIVGTGSFMAGPGLFGTTLITDPPAAPASVPGTQLLVQSMASFGASASSALLSTTNVLSDLGAQSLLAASAHYHE